MTTLLTNQARAYVNWGRWIADCPLLCGGALKLDSGQSVFICPECKSISSIEWPDNADEIWEALEKRVVPNTRNWFPASHYLALKANCPHGQTVAELNAETMENAGG